MDHRCCGINLLVRCGEIILTSRQRKRMLTLIRHPTETVSLIYFLSMYRRARIPTVELLSSGYLQSQNISSDEAYCYFILTRVSRSFSAVILELKPILRLPVCSSRNYLHHGRFASFILSFEHWIPSKMTCPFLWIKRKHC